MATRPTPAQVTRAAHDLGSHVRSWRKLLGLTIQDVADRAALNPKTVSRLERGDPAVGLEAFLGVARALGRLDSLVVALDPYETDFGRARADQALPERVRR